MTHSTACLLACICWAFFALANSVITVLLVGFIVERGTPNKGLFRAIPGAEIEEMNETGD